MFDDETMVGPQMSACRDDLLIAHEHRGDEIGLRGGQRQGGPPRPEGIRRHRVDGDVDGLAGLESGIEGAVADGFDGDRSHPVERRRRRDTREESAPADGDDDGVEIGHLRERLREHGPRPCGDERVVVRVRGQSPEDPANSAHASAASAYSAPTCRTSAPYERDRSTLTVGAFAGTNTVAGTPASAAAHAHASPAFPPEAIVTPASGNVPSARWARMKFCAPRALNVPVYCMNSSAK